MEKETWKTIGIRDKWQIINGTVLIFSAIILYFVCFLLTLTIGMGVISAGGTMLATGLAFFGITGYIKNQMIHFEGRVEKQINEFEKRQRENYDTNRGRVAEVEESDTI